MAIELFDAYGRVIHSVVFNTVKDGSGDFYYPLINSDGAVTIVGATGTAAIGKVGHDSTGLGVGRATVTAIGTAEALNTAATPAKWALVTAETDNTNTVVVGAAAVIAALATRVGTPLEAGESVVLLIDDLSDVFVDAITSGEGVSFTYGT